MIRINKPTKIPEILTKKGIPSNKVNCDKYNKKRKAYENRTIEFKYSIKQKIYGGSTVKSVLKKAQHEKCCFCEKKQGDEYGAVEHFRPKLGYKLTRKSKLIKPGYYWLGYDWQNLFFVCGPCNTEKGNIFPIEDESKRASNHNKNITLEAHFLLDPCGVKDPRDYIKFKRNLIEGISFYGKKTIEICKLDRDSLNNERAKLINDIDARLIILDKRAHHSKDEIKLAEEYIKKAISSAGEFSGMAIDYLNTRGVILY